MKTPPAAAGEVVVEQSPTVVECTRCGTVIEGFGMSEEEVAEAHARRCAMPDRAVDLQYTG